MVGSRGGTAGTGRSWRLAVLIFAGLAAALGLFAAFVGYSVNPGEAVATPQRQVGYSAAAAFCLVAPLALARALGYWDVKGLLAASLPNLLMLILIADEW